jgi:hypothetical protein
MQGQPQRVPALLKFKAKMRITASVKIRNNPYKSVEKNRNNLREFEKSYEHSPLKIGGWFGSQTIHPGVLFYLESCYRAVSSPLFFYLIKGDNFNFG